MRKITVMQICFLGIATALNVVGANLALLLRLPIYLDSLGTVLSAVMLGPVYGMVPGILSGIISGCTSDVYSFYYIPVQMVVGVMAGVFFLKIRPDSRQFCKVLLTALCIVQAITDYLDRIVILFSTVVLYGMLPASLKQKVQKGNFHGTI